MDPWKVKNWPESQKLRCVKLYQYGITTSELAKRYEASERTIKRWVNKYAAKEMVQ